MDRQLPDVVRQLAFPEFREIHMEETPEEEILETPLEFATRCNLPFSNILLLTRALTHRSYVNENPDAVEDNERLEFLGDAVLDFITGSWLYHHYPEMTEGQLTRMRSALVRNEQLAEFARRLNLGRALRLGRGEIQAGGRSRNALLCGAFEALVGALYLQTDITSVKRFIVPFLESVSSRIILSLDEGDPKSHLQEWAQAQAIGTPRYHTVSESGPDHERVFEIKVTINGRVFGSGTGRSKQIAEQDAAQSALKSIKSI
jgi:ribonuclease-3